MTPPQEINPRVSQSLHLDYRVDVRGFRDIYEIRLEEIHNTDYADIAEKNQAIHDNEHDFKTAESKRKTKWLQDLADAKVEHVVHYNALWQSINERCARALTIDFDFEKFFNLRNRYRQTGSTISRDEMLAQINLFHNQHTNLVMKQVSESFNPLFIKAVTGSILALAGATAAATA